MSAAEPEAVAEERDEEAGEESEEESEQRLDPETRARRDAALRQVRRFGDPVLRARALEVDRFDAALRREAERMTELMHDALGIGLAATQVGILNRLLVYQADPEDPVRALVNPVIEWASEELDSAQEGCLSIPGIQVLVERPVAVRVRAQDPEGRQVEVSAEGLEARVIQHEIDHLDGILMIDRIPRQRRKEAMRALREGQRSQRERERAGETSAGEPERDPTPA